ADALQASDADSVTTLPVDGSRKASGSLTLTPEAVAPSQAGQRAEHYQQLADRLGQALGQRLQAQIERGEWKMQMRMDPASLGRIDLELQMRSGGLDAIFRSDNPLTRELITQGLPKLRDSLSQSGTAVANVWVNGESAGQSGGNPTPSRTPRSSPQTPGDADGGSGQSTAAALPVAGVRQGGSSTALDVLA
ncbi:MAG: flagellar hook-length control protein FliK, partial [Polaromonas sp.]